MVSIQKIALKSLRRIFENGWVFEDAVMKDDRIDLLTKSDKELLRQSVLTVLRHKGEIDKFLSQFTKVIDDSLRLGVAQIILLKQPAKKIVPDIIAQAEEQKEKSLYSAVLNRLSQKEFKIDTKLNYQNWMSGSWRKAYGDKAEKIMASMLQNPTGAEAELPEADLLVAPPNSETGLISIQPELLHQIIAEDIMTFVQGQKEALEEAYASLKKGQVALYANNSLQYEEGEGLVRKLDADKWQLLEQQRILPCDSGGYGVYWAKLKKL